MRYFKSANHRYKQTPVIYNGGSERIISNIEWIIADLELPLEIFFFLKYLYIAAFRFSCAGIYTNIFIGTQTYTLVSLWC